MAQAFGREMAWTLAEKPEWSAQAWEQLSRSVDQLANGEAYSLHGWELPDDRPARVLGVNIDFMLGADDVLRVAP